jgi:hypothetical protein
LKRRSNHCLGFSHQNPWAPILPDHALSIPCEIPTEWVLNHNLKSVDLRVLLALLVCCTPDFEVQLSRKQIARATGHTLRTISTSIKRLTKLHYIRKLPTANGFIPVYKVHPVPYKKRKIKPKKSDVLKHEPPSAEGRTPEKGDRGA